MRPIPQQICTPENNFGKYFFVRRISRSARTIAGLHHMHRLGRMRIHEVGHAWKWQMRQSAAKMGVYKSILLLESEIVQSPILQGFFASPALSFTGSDNQLLNRIKRIIFKINKQLSSMDKFSIATSIIAVTFLSAAYFAPIEVARKAAVSHPVQETALAAQGKNQMPKVIIGDFHAPSKRLKKSEQSAPTDSLQVLSEIDQKRQLHNARNCLFLTIF
ncbi:hypothetical protein [Dyadobacter sp. CY326]|uniref:hypothetical protein n=1 Tax=Dyadobacter sp. CY326 TaxID=2907300 RepID=UPI001F1A3E04|nr:hypothetical protein [Dyadobacter sp. CY326]MCE7064591.1 hypothetical protein [Dyadobacter sp. CY326]